jgi:hypothetical protein
MRGAHAENGGTGDDFVEYCIWCSFPLFGGNCTFSNSTTALGFLQPWFGDDYVYTAEET